MQLPSGIHSRQLYANQLVTDQQTERTVAQIPGDVKTALQDADGDNQDIITDALRVYLLLDQDAVMGFLDQLWELAPSMEQAQAVSAAQDAVLQMPEVPQR